MLLHASFQQSFGLGLHKAVQRTFEIVRFAPSQEETRSSTLFYSTVL